MLRPSLRLFSALFIAFSAGSFACGGTPVSGSSSTPPKRAQTSSPEKPPIAAGSCDGANKLRAAIPDLVSKGKLGRARRVLAQVIEACPERNAETRAKDLITSAELAVELLDYPTARENVSKLLEMPEANAEMKRRAQATLAAAVNGAGKLDPVWVITEKTLRLIERGNLFASKGDEASLRIAREAYQATWNEQPTKQAALGLGIVARKLGDQVQSRQFLDRAFALFDADKETPIAALPNYDRLTTRIHWSSNGRFIVVAQGEENAEGSDELAVVDTMTGTEYFHWFKLGVPHDPVALSTDGKLLGIKMGEDGFVVDVGSRMVVRTLPELPGSAYSAFSPDMTQLAGSDGRNVFLLDLADRSKRPILKNSSDSMMFPLSVLFSPDGKTLAFPLSGDQIVLWNIAKERIFATLGGQRTMTMYSAFSRDGTHLLASEMVVGELHLWDVRSGAMKRSISLGPEEFALAIATSADGSAIAASDSHGLTVWNANTGAVRTKLVDSYMPTALAFSPDGERLAMSCVESTVCILDFASNKVEKVANVQDPAILSLAISPDGKTLVALPDDKTLRIVDLQNGTMKSPTSVPEDTRAVAISNDGKLYGMTGTTLRIWNAQTGATLREETFTFRSSALSFSPDGAFVAVAVKETIRLYPIATKEPPRELLGHTKGIDSLAFSPDGRLLASGSFDKSVRIWDLTSGAVKHVLNGHSNVVTGVAFSADGKLLASVAGYNPVQLWDVETGTSRSTLKPLKADILYSNREVAFSPKGSWLAILGRNKADIWDLATAELQPMVRSQSDGSSVAFTPDGQWLVTGWDNGTIFLQPSEGKGTSVSIRFITNEDAGYVVDSLGHAELLGSRPCLARGRIWCRVNHLGLPFDLCEDQVFTRGLIAKTLAHESLNNDPLQGAEPPSCLK